MLIHPRRGPVGRRPSRKGHAYRPRAESLEGRRLLASTTGAPAGIALVADRFFDGIGFGPGVGGIAGDFSPYTIEPLDGGGPTALDPLGYVVTTSDPKTAPVTVNGLTGLNGFTTTNGVEFPEEWFTAGVQSITVTSVSDPSVHATLSNIDVIPAGATTFRVSGLAPTTTAGVAQTLTVTALDPYGNVDTNYFGSVDVGSSDPKAQFPMFATFVAGTGVTTIPVTPETAGPQFVDARATVTSTFTIAPDVTTVVPAAVTNFVVSGFPSTTAGLAQLFTVTPFDAFGNVATNYTGTIHFSSSDVAAGLPADYTFTQADRGTHAFTATLTTSGTQSITVADTVDTAALGAESGIAVAAGAATHLVITGAPNEAAGKAFTLLITAVDAFGNVATGYRGKVHITDSAGASGLPSDFTFNAGNAGVVSVSVTLNAAGAQTLMLTDVASPAINGSLAVNVAQKPSGGGGGGGGGGGKTS